MASPDQSSKKNIGRTIGGGMLVALSFAAITYVLIKGPQDTAPPEKPSSHASTPSSAARLPLREDRIPQGKSAPPAGIKIQTLGGFTSEYARLLASEDGQTLRKSTYGLITDATYALSLEDFQLFCEGLKGIEVWQHGMQQLAGRYGAENYEAGLAWLKTLPEDSASHSIFSGFCGNLSPENRMKTIDFATALGDKATTGAMLYGLLSAGDPATTRIIVEMVNTDPSLMPGNFYPLSAATAAFVQNGDYSTALEINAMIKDKEQKQDSIRSLMIVAVAESPSKAAELIARIPDTGDKMAAIGPLMDTWIKSDPEAASMWANAQTKGPVKDAAARSVSRALLMINQDEALQWAAAIEAPGSRTKQMKSILNYVKDSNPGAYEAIRLKAEPYLAEEKEKKE